MRVNAVAPGTFLDAYLAQPGGPAKAQRRVEGVRLNRVVHPREVGLVTVFLASGAASYITGPARSTAAVRCFRKGTGDGTSCADHGGR